jgi:hypothetical protein
MIRFNQKIQSCDLENKILQMGGKAGDTMKINGVDFIID